MTVRVSIEAARGCGHRKEGGLYLVAPQPTEPCSKLPIPLHVCPTCGAGIKQARGWTWISVDPLLDPGPHDSAEHEQVCPLGTAIDWTDQQAGLIWVGSIYYPTASSFMAEAREVGVSRRIHKVPRRFKLGETWVALAHPKGVTHPEVPAEEEGHYSAGVITFFKPTAVEYILKGDETNEELDALEAKGYSLVKVIPAEQLEMQP